MEAVGVLARGAQQGGSAQGVDPLVVTLFTTEAARLVSLARFFVDDRTAAEDLVQEAFIRLARSSHRIHDEARAAAYLRSIVINLARDHNRRGLVSLRHRPPAVEDEPSAEEQATGRESRREVVAALRGLPKRQRDCVALRYYLELPVPEIAETLGLSVNSVKTHLQRGLRSMAVVLQEKHQTEEAR
jgi:RNA polymerase sigma factor (sigma-70 family)